ncbi:lanthionine synthetase LanC family protein [Nonomuraea sp. NPDC049750]|uniref:lanthionine synthetase LanC family protein n=1 Tax=Nonomuraea sp. NPDC049750 TaxID=3154738 RepID=UPI0033CABA0B
MSLDRTRSSSERAETPLTAAIMAGRWIRSAAVDDERGRHWRANPDPRGRSALAAEPASLYAGAAGIVLFFLELAAATGHEAYLDEARAGARYLSGTWANQTSLSLYHGLSGTVVALAEAGWVLGDGEFEAAAVAAADRIVRSARPLDGGPGWSRDPAQSGDGGVVLGLLHASSMLGMPAYQDLAVEAGARIARLAVPGHLFGHSTGLPDGRTWPGDGTLSDGQTWPGDCSDLPGKARDAAGGRADLPVDAVTPGFLSGTAGTAFLLARLYGVTGDPLFLDAARRGAGFVQMVSVVAGRCAAVPHHVPQGRGLHYLGFCSGSAGVARLFYELYRVTGEADDLAWCERLAHGIVESGVPHRRTPGFWNVSCQCCGTAGLLELFVGLWAATGRKSYLDFASVLAEHLIGRAVDHDGRGLRWYQAYRRLRPGEVSADTGYMIGAAGIGAALLHLDAALQGDQARRVILLPDNPFPSIPVPAHRLSRPGAE